MITSEYCKSKIHDNTKLSLIHTTPEYLSINPASVNIDIDYGLLICFSKMYGVIPNIVYHESIYKNSRKINVSIQHGKILHDDFKNESYDCIKKQLSLFCKTNINQLMYFWNHGDSLLDDNFKQRFLPIDKTVNIDLIYDLKEPNFLYNWMDY